MIHTFVVINNIVSVWETGVKNKKPKKKSRKRRSLAGKHLVSFFYDLAKISFTALVVGSVVSVATQQERMEYWVLIFIGVFVTYIFSYIGYKIIKL